MCQETFGLLAGERPTAEPSMRGVWATREPSPSRCGGAKELPIADGYLDSVGKMAVKP
jgi:hypothetical protein